jgi:hypothetical protein
MTGPVLMTGQVPLTGLVPLISRVPTTGRVHMAGRLSPGATAATVEAAHRDMSGASVGPPHVRP